MAKGQQRSNREVRKPKKEKVPVKAASPFGTCMRNRTPLAAAIGAYQETISSSSGTSSTGAILVCCSCTDGIR